MKRCRLKEDKLPQKLPVKFSSAISKKIDAIDAENQNNGDALFQWRDYLEGIVTYISNPVIAWDNMGRYPRFPNGAIFISDFDYNVGYTVIIDNVTNRTCVYVFMVNLNLEEFGLKKPPTLKENKIVLTESNLRKIISETLIRLLYN